ncbi:uncharacterized protein G2W53_029932 [Senna tora]|uniref:Uncharacterized protein n=1 Tax=Senna tora TaxID=362788 RepID=A0A834T4E5_9FABA|nr:uncharacterized protein G2W53_029932 [Senna tora]
MALFAGTAECTVGLHGRGSDSGAEGLTLPAIISYFYNL